MSLLRTLALSAMVASCFVSLGERPLSAQEPQSQAAGGSLQGVIGQPQAPAPLVKPRTAQLVGLIQNTVEPDSWAPTAAPAAAGAANTVPATVQLVVLIQTHVRAETWDVNGGLGTIQALPW